MFPLSSGDRYIGVSARKIARSDGRAIRPGQVFSLLAATPLGASKCGVKKNAGMNRFWPFRHQFLPFDCEYLENGLSRSVYVSIRV